MPKGLLVLIAVEVAVVLLLGLQLAIAPATGATPTPPPAATPRAPAAAVETAGALPLEPAPEPAWLATHQRTEVEAIWNADDPIGVLLTGTVRWRDGAPVEEPTVYLSQGREHRGASSGKDGSYAVPGLAPGSWRLTVSHEGANSLEREQVLTDAAVQRLDLVLDRSYAVKVFLLTPDGKDLIRQLRTLLRALAEPQVVGQREPFPDRLAPTRRAASAGDATWNGEMNPVDGFAGVLHLKAAPPAHVAVLLRHLVLAQQRVEPGQDEVRFEIDPAAVRPLLGSLLVRVLDDETGAPLATARVSLHTANAMGTGPAVDADGRAVVTDALPGLMRLAISAAGYEQVYRPVRIEPGQRLDLGEIRLGKVLPLRGRVVDEHGKPASARLCWTELKWRSTAAAFDSTRSGRVEADGTFSLWGTGRGRIAVQAFGADRRVAFGVFDNPPASPIELRLAAGVELTVRRPADPTRSFTLTVCDGSRQPVAAWELEPSRPQQTFSLPPGNYTFEVHDQLDRLLQSGALPLASGPFTMEVR